MPRQRSTDHRFRGIQEHRHVLGLHSLRQTTGSCRRTNAAARACALAARKARTDVTDIDIEAIRARDRSYDGTGVDSPEADRRALLVLFDELDDIATETQLDFRFIKDLVREKLANVPVPRARDTRVGRIRGDISAAQWRMLLELVEPNGNPENEWRFPRSKLASGGRLEGLGLAKEHYRDAFCCVFSITDAGRARLAHHRSQPQKTHETP